MLAKLSQPISHALNSLSVAWLHGVLKLKPQKQGRIQELIAKGKGGAQDYGIMTGP